MRDLLQVPLRGTSVVTVSWPPPDVRSDWSIVWVHRMPRDHLEYISQNDHLGRRSPGLREVPAVVGHESRVVCCERDHNGAGLRSRNRADRGLTSVKSGHGGPEAPCATRRRVRSGQNLFADRPCPRTKLSERIVERLEAGPRSTPRADHRQVVDQDVDDRAVLGVAIGQNVPVFAGEPAESLP